MGRQRSWCRGAFYTLACSWSVRSSIVHFFCHRHPARWPSCCFDFERPRVKGISNEAAPAFKAPGPDGYQAVFFQNCWDLVNNDVCSFVKTVFQTGIIPEGVNDTLITLVPKGGRREEEEVD